MLPAAAVHAAAAIRVTCGLGAPKVDLLEPEDVFLYLAPGTKRLQATRLGNLPQTPEDCVRVVCISDTHNEHSAIRLPPGDLLVHAGDCLTQSGVRHVLRNGHRIDTVKPAGEALLESFARWLGEQPFRHKVMVAGNHDLVLQGLGKQRVQEIIDGEARHGRAVYLEHETVTLGGMRVFGSPFGHWSSQNNAFAASDDYDYTDLPEGLDIVITHGPALLPGRRGAIRETNPQLISALRRVGARLHVCGHCHWAHGLYHTAGATDGGSIPSVLASVCDSHWLFTKNFASADGLRGDPLDHWYGGYNLVQPAIVCDLRLPCGRQTLETDGQAVPTHLSSRLCAQLADDQDDPYGRPALLFFGPPNDPAFVKQILPPLRKLFDVTHVDAAADGVQAVQERSYVACVAKLGTKGNLGSDVIAELRRVQGFSPFVVIHSATASTNASMREKLNEAFKIDLFAAHGEEEDLLSALAQVAAKEE
eukprot:TRINITY_DN31510_c0_g3_i1.p1 TRINITY_DN31510_c0_g3~~TRINITY_DN31510_c0_g3_i1.p1  ORF type:complete len:494 (-),score=59.00 TRINITY_DN31510_c0_g3_i1:282-1712(-)